MRRSHLTRNPVLLAKAPKLDADEVEPYDVREIQRLFEAAARRRNGARWALALALGLRQGEALGLTWDDVELDKASKAGRRTIGLPPPLVALLRTHRAEQQQERAKARQLWHDEGWVFASPTGQPINPRTDHKEWKRLLKEAGLREARLHDARHTAATVLLVLRQPTPTVMSLMGWSSESMAARYQHVTDTMRTQVASQVGELIWDSPVGSIDHAALMVRPGPLAVLIDAVEECIAGRHTGSGPGADVLAALAELREALSAARTPPETSNETKTETRRASDR